MNLRQKSQIILALLATLPLGSQAGRFHGEQDKISVSVITDDRGRVKEYGTKAKRGSQRSYIVAQKGERYSIHVRNNTRKRVGIVIAVDGRNIISGKKSYLKSTEKMYVLNAGKSATYDGWRSARNKVNRFYFTKVSDSYADNWGDRSASGVIAVAAFKEQSRRPVQIAQGHSRPQQHNENPRYDYDPQPQSRPQPQPNIFGRGNSNAPSSSSNNMGGIWSKRSNDKGSQSKRSSSRSAKKAGTGYGESEYSPTQKVRFKPRKKAFNKQFIKYEWRRTLCRKGIIECYNADNGRGRGENRFWDENEGEFAPPPQRIRQNRW